LFAKRKILEEFQRARSFIVACAAMTTITSGDGRKISYR
jgi:hypothetical protein